ncbi:class I SAM-dependent methyltransferase [Oceanobacillus bengalensis]|uniref:Class I SAM-dependent methyltransferase n=1 Tax=Oceanobacillus bengalensis TaxID=1435466 RepID=A0A494Z1U8_9BACI|nr:class I SAM-dependent methyltransferase [Oceanobacillus bengalensis]RKQ16280.1 class I SAM-dependent methyltransferase [Oceanobacillus bengalensis]
MNNKNNVKDVFSKNKEAYVTSKTHAKGSDLTLLVNWLEAQPEMQVLDIATGGGHVAKHLSPYVKTVFATDLTKEMLENTATHLTNLNNIHYIIADAEELPFLDNSFDIITCRIAAHHFPNPEKFIKEVERVLKIKGKFLFIDNIAAEDNIHDQFVNTLEKMRDYSHVKSRKITEWQTFFHKYNLSILHQKKNKKQLPYEEWVTRTMDDEAEIEKVNKFIRNAPEHLKNYFQIAMSGERIISFTIDEWMVLLEKDGF